MTAPLVVEDLTVVYSNGHRALDALDLRVEEDERCAVVGRSGSGKSTLVLAVLGLLPAGTRVSGSIRVGGREVLGASDEALRQLRGPVVGYVPQDPFAACDPMRTVGHHVAEAWTAQRRRPPPGAVGSALRAVAMDEAERRRASTRTSGRAACCSAPRSPPRRRTRRCSPWPTSRRARSTPSSPTRCSSWCAAAVGPCS